MEQLSLGRVAEITGGELSGDPERLIDSVAPLETAGPRSLAFVATARYAGYLPACRAAAVMVSPALRDGVPEGVAHLVVADPHLALYRVLTRLHPEALPVPGVHPSAVVDATAQVAADACVEAFAVIDAGARVGRRCRIGAHAVVGTDAEVGDDSVIHAHATVYAGARIGRRCVVQSGARVGKAGFGFVWADGGHRRVPQIGGCVLGDDVEVGCNSTVDRGSIGDTVVGNGTKIDNLVQVGHNAQIGRHVLLVSQVGIAGSTRVGDGAVLAGQVGVGGHLSIGAGARIGAQAGVTGDVPPNAEYSGYPARPHREALRAQAALFRLADLFRRMRAVESELGRRREPAVRPGDD